MEAVLFLPIIEGRSSFKIFRALRSIVAIEGFQLSYWIQKINQLLMDNLILTCILTAGLFVRKPENVTKDL